MIQRNVKIEWNDMNRYPTHLIRRIGTTATLLLISEVLNASSVDGIWVWTSPGRNGGQERTNTLTLAAEGPKLTGKLTAPGREGKLVETPIAGGKIDGDTLAFSVVREFNGNTTTNKYTGKLAGDKITGKIEFERNGEHQSRDWEAKR